MIVADTGVIVALIDEDDRHHEVLRGLYERPGVWVLPWAILPEVDYLLLEHLGARVELEFVRDLAEGRWAVDWGVHADLERARELCEQYEDLELGVVDAIVMATAERLRARAIATLDVRDFGAVALRGRPRLLPRDLK